MHEDFFYNGIIQFSSEGIDLVQNLPKDLAFLNGLCY